MPFAPSGTLKRGRVDDLQKLREAIELARNEMEKAQRDDNLSRVAEFQYGKIPALEKQLRELEAKTAASGQGGPRLLQEEVTADEIAEVSRAGRASPSPACSKARRKNSCGWTKSCTNGSSARMKPCRL